MHKSLLILLAALLVILQYQLWFTDSGIVDIWQLKKNVILVAEQNNKGAEENAVLFAEVNDLKSGTEAIEERARSELGMIKENEVFFQIIEE